MNQSNFIFFALLLAFVVYITMRGELPTYMGFFVPNPNAGSGSTPASTSSNGFGLFSLFAGGNKGGTIPQSSSTPNQPGTTPALGGGSTPIVPGLSPFGLPGF